MAILIDSNIIIYSYLNKYEYLRELLYDTSSYTSAISRVEILGYHQLKSDEEKYYEKIFTFINVVEPSKEIFDEAIQIRRQFNLKLGDSIIAATGVIYNLSLYTRNLRDFGRIKTLSCIDPVK